MAPPDSVRRAVQLHWALVLLGLVTTVLTVVLEDDLIRSWAEGRNDIRPLLERIDVPTLIVAGGHDGATAGAEMVLHKGIPGSELIVFEGSSHFPFAEEPERFARAFDSFLTRVEGA